ncbi:multiprotein-bridging factor 1 family protein [Streptomyces sp. NPDC059788]|uniref:helix-turn-helix domain-containing protein n=1 Tax=Streptomyces sp. NPDC059788 TaxID=3346948 RepID=UPI0036495CE8
MERDWRRLADAIKRARESAGMTQVDLAKRADMSESSVQNLESGLPRTRIPRTLAKVEEALGWAAGSGVEILDGAAGPVSISKEAEGFHIAKLSEDELQDAVTMSAIAVTDNLTAREIRELSQRIVAELKRRGALDA